MDQHYHGHEEGRGYQEQEAESLYLPENEVGQEDPEGKGYQGGGERSCSHQEPCGWSQAGQQGWCRTILVEYIFV